MFKFKKLVFIALIFALVFPFDSVAGKMKVSYKNKYIGRSKLQAYAEISTHPDRNGRGEFESIATYNGQRTSNLSTSVKFYVNGIGGSVSVMGVTAYSGSPSVYANVVSHSYNSDRVTIKGDVVGSGFWWYIGLYSTSSFSYHSSKYSVTAII